MVMGGEGASPAFWEVHPKWGRTRKARSFSAVQAAAPARQPKHNLINWVYQIMAGYSSSKASLWHIPAAPPSVLIYESLGASLPDVPVLSFPQELEAVHPEADPHRGSVQRRRALGKGNQAFWKWQSPWALLRCLTRLYWAASALYKLQVSLMCRRMLWKAVVTGICWGLQVVVKILESWQQVMF